MIDCYGKTWTANAERTLLTCEDGRQMSIVPQMSDDYCMSVQQKIADDAQSQAATDALDAAAVSAVKADDAIQYLINHTPAEIDAYVVTTATDLASAIALLSTLAQAVGVLARGALR